MNSSHPRAPERRRLAAGILATCIIGMALTAVAEPPERYRLYSKVDPSAEGGIRGTIASPAKPIEQILAIPPDEFRLVYKGDVSGPDRRDFSFHNLPMRRYDLVVIYQDSFYEGLTLERNEDTLTARDRAKIKQTFDKAEPFFTHKIIHRLEGTTGRSNMCRAIVTYMRERKTAEGPGGANNLRRTFKVVSLKDVGPGWQVVRARDLYPVWTSRQFLRPTHNYRKSLSRIRVTHSIKDLGTINL